MRESSLADYVPLWRTLREQDTTALITPAFDYVGGLALGAMDLRFSAENVIESVGEGLRSLVSSLDDECTLHLLYQVSNHADEDLALYESQAAQASSPVLQQYILERARWLKDQPLRSCKLFCFFSAPPSAGPHSASVSPLQRGALGMELLFKDPSGFTRAEHERRLTGLAQLRDQLAGRFRQVGIGSRELGPEEIQALHHALLNPERARARLAPPRVQLRQNLWDPATVPVADQGVLELTEAEMLCHEAFREERTHFTQGSRVRRVCTLKVLPELGTSYGASRPALELACLDGKGTPVPFGYTLAVTLRVHKQSSSRFTLSTEHALVDAVRQALPFLQQRSLDQAAGDQAKQNSLMSLMNELNTASSKLVDLSMSVLLEGDTLQEVEAQTQVAISAFNDIGNSQLVVEELTQLNAFLSMLPGAGNYQLRKKGCTSRNAADFLPVFAPWSGCALPRSFLTTTMGDAFRLDLFDPALEPHHGLVVADTGSGKSMSLGSLTVDALASGTEAILIDNGGSWKALTEVLGGIHIPVDLNTSICPFLPYPAMLLPGTQDLDPESVQEVVSFLEVCVLDRDLPAFDKVQTDLVGRGVRRCYEEIRTRADPRPVMGDFRDALLKLPTKHPDDRAIIEQLCRKLRLFCDDGEYAPFLNRPSPLRFDAKLLTFDLQAVSKNLFTKQIAMATLIQAINSRARGRRTRTLVEVDEGHTFLGQGDAGERFLEKCYRTMRKFNVAMWMVSQHLPDFMDSKSGRSIVGNSNIKLFLRHGSGHDEVAQHLGLSPRALRAFKGLQKKDGHYSDFLLLYGPRIATVRLAPHPFAYWLLTTRAQDRELLERAAQKNPSLSRLELLQQLARRHPHGSQLR